MASLPHVDLPKGRNFTAAELVGKQIRVVGPIGYTMMVIADGEVVANADRFILSIAQNNITEAVLTLCHADQLAEEVTLRDYIELSFSALVSEVQ